MLVAFLCFSLLASLLRKSPALHRRGLTLLKFFPAEEKTVGKFHMMISDFTAAQLSDRFPASPLCGRVSLGAWSCSCSMSMDVVNIPLQWWIFFTNPEAP